MKQEDGINFLQGHQAGSDLTGALIREEYSKAFRAVIDFAATGKVNYLTEAASDDEPRESGQNEIGVQDSYLNPFVNLPATRSKRGGFILIGHPGIGEYTPSLSSKSKLSHYFCRKILVAHCDANSSHARWTANHVSIQLGPCIPLY